ncbi:MAG: hypothetical protein HXX14_10150 [Bacteroidetes bacterium]|nr:hypothetical protein [Bacteroidota bacterium]
MERNHLNSSDKSSGFSLEGLKKENPFRVPEGYFDELPLRINERIDVNPVIKKYRRIHPGIFAAAASVVVLLGLVMFLRTNGIKTEFNTEASYASVADTHIVTHLEKAILNGELDETELMDAVIDNPSKTSVSQPVITKSKVVSPRKADVLKTLSDEEIIEYLVQQDTPSTTSSEVWQ